MKSLKMVVFYDNWCSLCIAIKEKIQRLDWFGLIEMIGIREKGIEKEISVPLEDLEKKMYAVIKRNGKYVSGLDAFISISARIPMFFVLWPFLIISSKLGIGHIVYRYISEHRTIVPVGKCDDSFCKLK
ncbi:thiol-disulfide oxidoreductase DCC family protein [Bacillus sp. JJ1764]|uniref:thiol-disulfide oxidoreductase DCC family protein n=1 Tax=Bacillus sp. JJ1764 TaxID=3122964 RepID=UPI002FFF67A0